VRIDLDTVMTPATIATLPYGTASHRGGWLRHLLGLLFGHADPPSAPPPHGPWVRHTPAIAIGPWQPRSGRPLAAPIDADEALLPDRDRMVSSSRAELRAIGRAAAVGLRVRRAAPVALEHRSGGDARPGSPVAEPHLQVEQRLTQDP